MGVWAWGVTFLFWGDRIAYDQKRKIRAESRVIGVEFFAYAAVKAHFIVACENLRERAGRGVSGYLSCGDLSMCMVNIQIFRGREGFGVWC